ncbi:MAG: hypothetical protein F6K25_03000 [Okeania sp. SIO2G4]|uniref:hypothetical protein n=1 Tax=unclassified Okeania TaxID=2634635 RepID=UPI0013BCA30F|nr:MULTISPECIES: hypothetical protein [unclassified Okeania]NEP06006.1 hypothetical protein [Okeania sp. SIO4D6]NEP72780.1 hypothetical protein [Okeania sp. SIO2G5]NEP93470.1 hypothetical protein [Okeania sp. SIO2F5]NEQ89767.1 hypothetical protein [Okeania sp. SIO2G4]
MVNSGGVNPPLTPPGRGSQESGGERITKMGLLMTIGEFFYVQLTGFDIIDNL